MFIGTTEAIVATLVALVIVAAVLIWVLFFAAVDKIATTEWATATLVVRGWKLAHAATEARQLRERI